MGNLTTYAQAILMAIEETKENKDQNHENP